jgi:hypothetical protein
MRIFGLELEEEMEEEEEMELEPRTQQQLLLEEEREVEVINNNYQPQPSQFQHPNNNQLSHLNQSHLTDETDDGTIENDKVEYAVLLPDSFAILDSTFDDELNYIL